MFDSRDFPFFSWIRWKFYVLKCRLLCCMVFPYVATYGPVRNIVAKARFKTQMHTVQFGASNSKPRSTQTIFLMGCIEWSLNLAVDKTTDRFINSFLENRRVTFWHIHSFVHQLR